MIKRKENELKEEKSLEKGVRNLSQACEGGKVGVCVCDFVGSWGLARIGDVMKRADEPRGGIEGTLYNSQTR